MFTNVIDNGTSNSRTIGGVGVCVPHWCPSETYPENAWKSFGNVIGHGSSNFRAMEESDFVSLGKLHRKRVECV